MAFVLTEARAPAPLVRLDLLRDRSRGTGLACLMLVSAIVMATLVVGPFYLSGVLGLDPVETGMVMSVGPAVAAVTGIPAGRLVDRLGSFPVIVAGLLALMIGSMLLTILPGLIGVGGYAASLVILTFGYAMFQAANMTAIMQRTASERRRCHFCPARPVAEHGAHLGCVRDGDTLCDWAVPRRSNRLERGKWRRAGLGLLGCGVPCRYLAGCSPLGTTRASDSWGVT